VKHELQPSVPVMIFILFLFEMDHSKVAMLSQTPPVFLHSREVLVTFAGTKVTRQHP
jgi:hypothetical protein